MAALLREAGLAVLKKLPRPRSLHGGVDDGDDVLVQSMPIGKLQIEAEHFETALSQVKPSVSRFDRDRYRRMEARINSGQGGNGDGHGESHGESNHSQGGALS